MEIILNDISISYTKIKFHDMDYISGKILIDLYTWLKDDEKHIMKYYADSSEEIVCTYELIRYENNKMYIKELKR